MWLNLCVHTFLLAQNVKKDRQSRHIRRRIRNGAKNENKKTMEEEKKSWDGGDKERERGNWMAAWKRKRYRPLQRQSKLSDGRYLCQHHAASTKRLLASLRFPTNYYKWCACLEKHWLTQRAFRGKIHTEMLHNITVGVSRLTTELLKKHVLGIQEHEPRIRFCPPYPCLIKAE